MKTLTEIWEELGKPESFVAVKVRECKIPFTNHFPLEANVHVKWDADYNCFYSNYFGDELEIVDTKSWMEREEYWFQVEMNECQIDSVWSVVKFLAVLIPSIIIATFFYRQL